ncbi:S-layer homology domain-containing protein [Paenibacillus sp. TH7-28]
MKRKLSMGIIAILALNLLLGVVAPAPMIYAASSTDGIQITMNPQNGASNVDPAVTKSIKLQFDRKVQINKDSLKVSEKGKEPLSNIEMVLSDGSPGKGTNEITLVLPELKYNTTYLVQAEEGNFVDGENRSITSPAIQYSFTTKAQPDASHTGAAEEASPLQMVGGIVPFGGSKKIPVDTEFRVTFNRNIKINNESAILLVKKGNNTQLKLAVQVRASGSGLFIKPVHELDKGSVYYLSIHPGAVADAQTGDVYMVNKESAYETETETDKNSSEAPVLQSGEITNNTIILKYSKPLGTNNSIATTSFKVLVNQSERVISKVYSSGSYLYIELVAAIEASDLVELSYTPTASNKLVLSSGQVLAEIISYKVSNTSSKPTLSLIGIEGSGNTITITYNKTLKSKKLKPNQYSVLVNKSELRITRVEIVGSQVILTLASSLAEDDNVTISFNEGADLIEDLDGIYGNYFIDYVVKGKANTGSEPQAVQGMPSFVTAIPSSNFGLGGYLLNLSTAKSSSSVSVGGQNISRYTIGITQLQEAIKFLISINTNTSKREPLIFEVPTTEKAAELAIPLGILFEGYNSGKPVSFSIKYNETMYELPIEEIPFAQIAKSLNTGTLSVDSLNTLYLIIQLEVVSRDQISIPMTLNGVNVNQSSDPIRIRIIVVSESDASNLNAATHLFNISHIGKLYLRITGSKVTAANATLVKYDTVNKMIIPIPSKISGSNGTLVFSGNPGGNTANSGAGASGTGSASGAGSGSSNAEAGSAASGGLIVGLASGAANYGDTAKHWAKADIDELTAKFVVSPRNSESNAFEPDRNITRAEFAEYIAKALGLGTDIKEAQVYPDVKLDTRGGYIGAASKAGIITGYPDGKFRPDQYITREEMALMMVRALNYGEYQPTLSGTPAQALAKFKDASKIRYQEAVAKTVKAGVIQGVTTNTFQPQGNATRSQATVMIKRVLDKLNSN